MSALWVWLLAAAAASQPAQIDALRSSRLIEGVPVVPESALDQAMEGDIVTGLVDVEGSRLRKAWGVAVLDQPIDAVWAAVNDNASKTRLTRLNYVEVVEGEDCGPERLVFQYLDIRWLTDRWWLVEQRQNLDLARESAGRVRELSWRNVPNAVSRLTPEAGRWARGGMELPFVEGAWWLVDLDDGRTLVEYFCWSDPGGAVPARLASRFAAGGIVDTIEAMSSLAGSGPLCPLEPMVDAVASPDPDDGEAEGGALTPER